MSDVRKKCQVIVDDRRSIQPCSGLETLIGRTGPRQRGGGVDIQELYNLETMKPVRQLVVLHSGKHSKDGLVLNFCPVCGNDLTELFSDRFVPARMDDAP